MQYFCFTQRRPEACFHWQEMSGVNVADPRVVYNPENNRYVCRLVGPSAFVYPGYVERGTCWSGDKQRGMYSLDSNVVSEVLLVHPMCTIGWMPFVARERPPSNSFSPGETAAGKMTYITRFFHWKLSRARVWLLHHRISCKLCKLPCPSVAEHYGHLSFHLNITTANCHHYTFIKMWIHTNGSKSGYGQYRQKTCTMEITLIIPLQRGWICNAMLQETNIPL